MSAPSSNKRLQLRGLVCAVPLAWGLQAGAATDLCKPLAFPPVASAAWDADTGYEISVRDIGAGRLRITVVGDVLALDATRFTSLLRTVDKAPANVAEIILDARVVRVLGPLALQTGKIRISAHTVSFEGGGLVGLTRAPGAAADGLEIHALDIDLSKAQPIPFQLSVLRGTARTVSIRANRLLTATGAVKGDAAARLMWQRSSNFDGIVPAQMPPQWNVNVSEAGAAQAIGAMASTTAWPGYLAYKLRKHHAFAPFDNDRKKQLTARITAMRPLVESLQRADVLMDMDALVQLMERNLDRRGLGPAYVPSEDLVVSMKRFADSRDGARKQLANLRTIIASAHLTPALDLQALESARARIRTVIETQTRRRAEIDDVFTELGGLEAQGVEVGKAIEHEREQSRLRLEELKEKDKDLANIKIVTTVVAVGASFVGTPAAGAAIAAGVGVVGDVVYAHNAGQPLNTETLVSIGEKNAKLFNNLKAAQEAWDKHSADLSNAKDVLDGKQVIPKGANKPLTKVEAANLAGASAGDFGKKVQAAVNGMGAIPKPDSISLNGVEAENGALQRHLTRMTEVQRSISDAAARLNVLQSGLAADEAALTETRLVEQVLLELKPANDQEIIRWKTAALQLWARELQGLYQDAMDLRRSLFFETWKTPILPADLLTYPEEFTAYLMAGRYSPESPNATSPNALTATHLDNEIAKHMSVLDGIAKAVDQTWQTYLSERAAGAQPFFDQQELSARAGAPAAVRLFMDQINAQIRRQVESPNTRTVSPFTLLIPFDMTTPPQNLPERLLRTGVVSPKFADDQALVGKVIVFDITYRLAGELRRNNLCAYVDLSVPGGSTTATKRDQANDPANAVRAESEQPMSFENLRQSRAAPPARTLYFMSVTVGGSAQDSNWRSVPKLDSLTFWRRIVQ